MEKQSGFMNTMKTFVVAAAFAAFIAAPLRAAEITIESAQAASFEELWENARGTAGRGVLQKCRPPAGRVFVALHLKVKVSWGEEKQGVTVGPGEIALRSEGGADLHPVGVLSLDGNFKLYPAGFTVPRPPQGPAGGPFYFDPVFAVPADARRAALRMGAAERDVEIGAASPAFDPSSLAEFRVEKAEARDAIALGKGRSEGIQRTLAAPHGQLLAVTLEVTPKAVTNPYIGQMVLQTGDLGLVLGDGTLIPSAGHEDRGDFKEPSGVQMGTAPGGKGKPVKLKVFFAVPKGLTEFEVACLAAKVAKGRVGGAAEPPPAPAPPAPSPEAAP